MGWDRGRGDKCYCTEETPQSGFHQSSLHEGPECAGSRNPSPDETKHPRTRNPGLTLLIVTGGFFLLRLGPEVPILGLRWREKAQELLVAATASLHSSKCGPNEYFSRLAIFTPLLAGRIHCKAKFSLGTAIVIPT